MNLHRITNDSDWADIAPNKYNFWQKIAARTNAIVTPANAITIIGLLIVLYGLFALVHQWWWIAVIALAYGRLLDVFDGLVADKTGTKSKLGELLDATVDKIGTILTIVALFVAHTAPWWILTILLLPHVIISVIVVGARLISSRHIHPSRLGKSSMAIAWLSVVGIILIPALGLTMPNLFVIFVYAIVTISSLLGLYAAGQYLLNRSK